MPRAREERIFDEEIEDDGMEDELILRSLLQCFVIGAFFTTRYLMDVIFTPAAVQALSSQVLTLVRCILNAAWYAPVASLILLYSWGSLEFFTVVRWILKGSILRAVLAAVLDSTVVLPGWTKRHVWVPLAWWVTFTRVSSGRDAPQGHWCGGIHRFACTTSPWVIRFALFVALSSRCCGSAPHGFTTREWSIHPQNADPRYESHSIQFDPIHRESSHRDLCTSFRGYPVDCEELRRIREFNAEVMPRMLSVGSRGIRKAMNERGFLGHVWHVGHACPDPSKKSSRNGEDFGSNLFAQHAQDNMELGHCLVSCAEAEYVGAYHVRCTRAESCIPSCDDI